MSLVLFVRQELEVLREDEVTGLVLWHTIMCHILLFCGLFGFCHLLHPSASHCIQGGLIEIAVSQIEGSGLIVLIAQASE